MKQPDAAAYWISLARRDLAKAERLLQPPAFPEGTCFFAQQAAEKALKAYACHLGARRIPRTHDLSQLAALAAELGGEMPPLELLRALTPYAIGARYGFPLPSVEEAQDALRTACEVVEWVARRVPAPEEDPHGH